MRGRRSRLACLACLFLGGGLGCSWLVGVSEDPIVADGLLAEGGGADVVDAADAADAADSSPPVDAADAADEADASDAADE